MRGERVRRPARWGALAMVEAVVLIAGLLGAGGATAGAPVSYSSHATVSITPTGGGYEGRGQTVAISITSPKVPCRRYRRFTLELQDLTGYVEETHSYRTNAVGTWTLDVAALPTAPTRLVVTVPQKRLDQAHRCLSTRIKVPFS
jgi:hypothetical protein